MTPPQPTPVTRPPLRAVAARRPRAHPPAVHPADREVPAVAAPPGLDGTRGATLPVVLAALTTLDDDDLHMAMTQAQRLLADRPAAHDDAGIAVLRVEIVDAVEADLLAAHRARTAPAQLLHALR